MRHPALRPALALGLLALAGPAAPAAPADFLPPSGPHGSVAVPFAASVPGATEAAAARYVRADGRPLGALLAAVPGPGYDAGAALAAFAGGTPVWHRPVLLDGHPFTLVTVARADGGTGYAVGFAATRTARGALVDARAAPSAGAVHLVAEAGSAEAATALAAAALDHLAVTAPPLAFAGTTAALTAPVAAPNPAAGATTLRFALPEAGEAEVALYDALGRRVAVLADGWREAGTHEIAFETGGLAPGVYLVRLVSGGQVAAARLTRR
jgi:hypothetical protein